MKVFLSSTYNDLIEHRKAAHDALEQLGLHVIWMEAFGARPEDSMTACLKEVKESDLFVGIYAHRYGYIPAGSNVSITEQEFDHAQKLGKPIFGFIINKDYAWSPKHIEHDKKDKLNAFLNKVKKQPVEFFTTPDNLANNIASSIGHYLSEHSDSKSPIYQSPKPTGSTLPAQPFFFGRTKELEIIKSALSPDSRTWCVLIDGPGGIGKTALAIRAAHLAPATLFERKIFITAKIRELTAAGEAKLTDFTRPDYLAMLNELAKELGEDGNISRLAPDERADALRLLLVGKKALIVFDNLETLPEDERTRLFQFLSRLPTGNKAIVTSRRRSDVGALIVRLDKLNQNDALNLMSELAKNNPTLTRFAKRKERIQLYEITNGNPLLITWISAQLGRKGSSLTTISEASYFIDNAPENNDPLEYIFGDLLKTFTENETKVLAALTFFSAPANLRWVIEMTDLQKHQVKTALEDLSDRSILIENKKSEEFFLPPLTAQFIKTRRPKAIAQTEDKLASRAYALIKQFGGDNNYEGFKTLETEWPTIEAALPRLYKKNNKQLQSICNSILTFLYFRGKWDESLTLTKIAEEKALAAGAKDIAGMRAYDTSWIYYLRGQPLEIRKYAARAEKYWKNSRANLKAFVFRMYGLSFELEKNYIDAKNSFNKALKLWSKKSTTEDRAAVLIDLGYVEQNLGNLNAAMDDFNKALQTAKKLRNTDMIASALGSVASLSEKQSLLESALKYSNEALNLNEKIGNIQGIGIECCRMARVLFLQNKFDEALPYAHRAADIATRLHQKDELQDAQEILTKCEKILYHQQ